jgi:hypothetical protein
MSEVEHDPVVAEPVNPDHELFHAKPLADRVKVLEQKVEDLTTLLAAVYEKYMDRPIDLDEPTVIPQ